MKTALIIFTSGSQAGILEVVAGVPPAEADEIIVVLQKGSGAIPALQALPGVRVTAAAGTGTGACCMAGAAAAEGLACDLLIFLDAALPFSPKDIPLLTYRIKNRYYHLVLGSRLLEAGLAARQAFSTRVSAAVAGFLVKLVWGFTYTDAAPFRAIRTDRFRELELDNVGDGWMLQMQIRALRCGLKVKEVAVTCHGTPRSSGKFAWATVIKTVLVEFFRG